jgi:hypothetical protein
MFQNILKFESINNLKKKISVYFIEFRSKIIM